MTDRRTRLTMRVIRVASSPWLGSAVIALIVVYLSLASTTPRLLGSLLASSPANLYRHGILIGLTLLLCANLLIALPARVGLGWAHAGAWCSHLGLLILLMGGGWYAFSAESGLAVSFRGEEGWSAIRGFYLDRSLAVYVSSPGESPVSGRATGLPIDPTDPDAKARQLNLAVSTGSDDLEIQAAEYRPAAHLAYEWSNDSPLRSPAVVLEVEDGGSRRVVLWPSRPDTGAYNADGYSVVYHPDTSPDTLGRIAQPATRPALGHDLAMILTGARIDPTLVIVRPDGTTARMGLPEGVGAEVHLAGRKVVITPAAFWDHAQRTAVLRADAGEDGEPTTPAVRVVVSSPGFRRTLWIPFSPYPNDDGEQCALPSGKAVNLSALPRFKPLPAELELLSAQYQTYPGSVVPKDYRCTVRSGGKSSSTSIISLNHPMRLGPYQISQGSWLPSPSSPQEIHFLVASRPGLPIVWAGCIMIAVGFPYAFYVKPLILRRQKERRR